MLENLIVSLTLEMWTQSASRFFSSVYVFHAPPLILNPLNMLQTQQQRQKKIEAYQCSTFNRKYKTQINVPLKYSWLFI